MATIIVPSAGEPVLESWGADVAQALDELRGRSWRVDPFAYQSDSAEDATDTRLVGGAVIIPFPVPIGVKLRGYAWRDASPFSAIKLECALFRDTGASTFAQVADTYIEDTFTAGVETAWRIIAVQGGSEPKFVGPGFYWLVMRNTHAANSWYMTAKSGVAVGQRLQGYAASASTIAAGAACDPTEYSLSSYMRHIYLVGEVAANGEYFRQLP